MSKIKLPDCPLVSPSTPLFEAQFSIHDNLPRCFVRNQLLWIRVLETPPLLAAHHPKDKLATDDPKHFSSKYLMHRNRLESVAYCQKRMQNICLLSLDENAPITPSFI